MQNTFVGGGSEVAGVVDVLVGGSGGVIVLVGGVEADVAITVFVSDGN